MPHIAPRTNDSESTPYGQLRQAYYAGAWNEAERLCEEIVAGNPGDVTVLILLGEIALVRGDLAEARDRLRRVWQFQFPDLDSLLRQIRLVARIGDRESLERAGEVLAAATSHDPLRFDHVLGLAFVNELLGRIDEAISGYERASAIIPANAAPHTFRSILLLRRAWIRPLPAPAEKRQSPASRGRLAMTALGKMGRFGNQFFQYAYGRIYGQVHGLRVEVPDWIGRWLFDLDDPEPDPRSPLQPVEENPSVMGELLREEAVPVLANRDLWGYCQCHTSHLQPHQKLFRTLFQPGVRLRPSVEHALARLRERGRTVVAIHLRRGDYAGGDLFWPAPTSWYVDWLKRIWPELDAPVLHIASDDPQIGRDFADFSPVAPRDLGQPIPGAEMYPDFQILAEADLLAVSNSSFSVAAAMLNTRARACMRPDPIQCRLVPFDPWNTEVLWRAPAPAR